MTIEDSFELSFTDLDINQKKYKSKAEDLFDQYFYHNIVKIGLLQTNYTKRVCTPIDDTLEGYIQVKTYGSTASSIKTGLTPTQEISPLSVGPYLGVVFREKIQLSKNSIYSIHINGFVKERGDTTAPTVKLLVFNANDETTVGGQPTYNNITSSVITSVVSDSNVISNSYVVSFTQETKLAPRNRTVPATYFNPNSANQTNVNNGEPIGTIDGIFGTDDYYMTLKNSNSTPLNVYLALVFTDCIANDCFYLKSFDIKNVGTNGGTPLGSIVPYTKSVVPDGWLLCDGSEINRFTYADLFAIIGTTYGIGNGTTTFNLPDIRGRTIINQGQGAGLTNRVISATGGAETHTLTIPEMPIHNHGVTDPSHNHGVTDPTHTHGYTDTYRLGDQDTDNAFGTETAANETYTTVNKTTGASLTGISINNNTTGISINNTGGSQPHNNMQPFFVLNYIIKSKYSATSLYF